MKSQALYLSLFSGACGGDLACQHLLGWRCAGYVEIDKYCQQVIAQRIKDRFLDEAPIFSDIRDFIDQGYAESYKGLVDGITAGFPCQPFSVAGKRQWDNDERNLWPQTIRVIQKIKPQFVLLENVRGIQQYLPVVIRDLRRSGYTVERPAIVAAASVGAGHIRERLWVLAYLDGQRFKNIVRCTATQEKAHFGRSPSLGDCEEISSDPYSDRKLQSERSKQKQWKRLGYCNWWQAEPRVVRVVYGIPNGMDRIKALGNAQVPAVVATAWEVLTNDFRC